MPRAGQYQRSGRDGHVEPCGRPQRPNETQDLDQDEGCHERAEGRAENVRGIEMTEGAPRGNAGGPQRRHRQRKGRSHAGAKRQQARRDAGAGSHVIPRRAPGRGRLPAHQQPAPQAQERGDGPRRRGDAELRCRIQSQG